MAAARSRPGRGVVGQAEGHQQRAQIGVAQAQRPVVVRVARDGLGRVPRVVHQDLHGRNQHRDGVPVGSDVEGARGRDEAHQVQARQVAGRVIQEHVLAAWIRGVNARRVLAGMPLVDGVVELHAWIAALPRALGDLVHDLARLVGVNRFAALHRVGGEFSVALVGAHELVAHPHGVVSILIEDRRVSLGIGARTIVPGVDEGKCLGLLGSLALDELHDVGVLHVEDGHLGRAPRLAAALDDPGKGVEAAHKAERAAGRAAARHRLAAGAQRAEVGAGSRSVLEEHGLGARQVHDPFHRILDGVDETGRALRVLVARSRVVHAARHRVPVPVLAFRIRFQPVAAHVEPHRRVEGRLLRQQHVRQLVVEDGRIDGRGKVAAGQAPVADGLGHAPHQLAHAGFALRRIQPSVQVLRGHNVGRRHRPVHGHFHVLLLEDGVALGVGNRRRPALPLELVVGRDALGRKTARKCQPLLGALGGREGSGRSLKLSLVHLYILSMEQNSVKTALNRRPRRGRYQPARH